MGVSQNEGSDRGVDTEFRGGHLEVLQRAYRMLGVWDLESFPVEGLRV